MLNIETDIVKVYNGKIGCMCGCLGKYKTTPSFRGLVEEQRGYPVDDDEVNERSVKIIAKKVLSNPSAVFEDNYAYVEDRVRRRIQVVYFKKESV